MSTFQINSNIRVTKRAAISFCCKMGCLVIAVVLAACSDSEVTPPDSELTNGSATAIRFQEVTVATGLGDFMHETGATGKKWMPETFGSGGGFIDYDGDGWLDILLVGGGIWPEDDARDFRALWLYRNNGDGTFSLQTANTGLEIASQRRTYGFGLTCADYDNDGDEDLFLTTLYQNLLFRNDGGKFTETGKTAGVAGASLWSTAAIFFDADRDGWLDLYVGNYVDWSPEKDIFCSVKGDKKDYCTPLLYDGVPGNFYHNNGDGTFSDRTGKAGFLPAPGKTLGVAETDFNHDGWPDLVVASDTERDLLYQNNGDGTFTEKGLVSGIAFDEFGRAAAGMGIDAGVVDNSGQVTIFVGNFSQEMIGVFRHNHAGLFDARSAVSKIGAPSLLRLTFGLFLFDADLDSDLDLFAANGHIQAAVDGVQDGITYRQQAQLFRNKGDGLFEEVGAAVGGPFLDSLVCRAAAYADYDHDGDQDILLTENSGGAHLWRNDSRGNNLVRVKLRGSQSNRDALGAHLLAKTGDSEIHRRIRTGGSYLSNSEKIATFGAGQRTSLDSLIITWPDGAVTRLANIGVNQQIVVEQGKPGFRKEPLAGLTRR